MVDFPSKEQDIMDLATTVCNRMSGSVVFVNPPIELNVLRGMNLDVKTESDRYLDLRGQAESCTKAKQAKLKTLETNLKSLLSWAEVKVHNDDTQLKAIGWGGRKPSAPTNIPYPPYLLQITDELSNGSIGLKWSRPPIVAGCLPDGYVIERCETLPDGSMSPWIEQVTSIATKVTLTSQPCGVMLQYRIRSLNVAGLSVPSNVVEAIL